MSERKLVTIRKIKEIHPIPEADMIERAVIDGWSVVVKKDEFKPGDFCIYFEINSLLPDAPQYEFLRKSSWNESLNKYRLKTIKLKGVISQGLALPLADIIAARGLPEGADLTGELGVEIYEPPIPVSLGGDVKGHFPFFIPKTDEERIQNIPDILQRHINSEFVITEKIDGTSQTSYFKDGVFGFCGRNWEFKKETKNTYSEIISKYSLEKKLTKLGRNIAIQGELIGPGIQGNVYKLSEHKLLVFNVYDIDSKEYFNHFSTIAVCDLLELEPVPTLEIIRFKQETTVENILNMAEGRSKLYDTEREGIVIKSLNGETDIKLGRLSFKAISNKYLIKHNE